MIKKFLVFVLAFSAGLSSYLIYNHIPQNHISNFTPDFKVRCVLEGEVRNAPFYSRTFYGESKADFLLNAEGLYLGNSPQRVSGIVKVSAYGKNIKPSIGDRLRLEGELIRPSLPSNPGSFDYRAYLKNQRVHSLFAVKKKGKVEISKKGNFYSILNVAARLRGRMSSLIDRHVGFPQNEVLKAMLLGEREGIPEGLNDSFKKTGTIHILSISGLHVGFVMLFIIGIFKLLRIPRKLSYGLTIILLIFYAPLTGAKPPVVRAVIMSVAYLFGLLIDREHDLLNTLALAALIILAFIPNDLFDIGFQLSFLSVFSILYFTPKIEAFIPERIMPRNPLLRPRLVDKASYWVMKSLCVSTAAILGTAPLVVYHFNIFSPSSVAANLFAIPLSGLAVFEGMFLVLFGGLFDFLGRFIAQAAWGSLWLLKELSEFAAQLPFAYFMIRSISIFELLLIYGAIFLIFCYRRIKLSKAKLSIVLLVIFGFFVWKEIAQPVSKDLKITFFDVGHADAALIENPKGELILIDGGGWGDGDDGRWTIAPYLWKKGKARIDYIFATHPDSDHIGGLPFLLENFRVRKIFDNGLSANSQVYRAYKDAISKRRVPFQSLKSGDVIEISGFRLEVLNPPAEPFRGTKSDDNNNSVVLKITYKENSMLLCGDIERDATLALLAQDHARLKSGLLKLPHHGGGKQKHIDALIEAVNPHTIIISEKDIPRLQRQIAYLRAKGIDVRATAYDGAVIISLD